MTIVPIGYPSEGSTQTPPNARLVGGNEKNVRTDRMDDIGAEVLIKQGVGVPNVVPAAKL